MGWMMNVLIIPFAVLSMVVNTLGVTSLFRFKDVYMRMHGATKCSTLGALFASLAVIVSAIHVLKTKADAGADKIEPKPPDGEAKKTKTSEG